jgi:hypothetical protein
MAYLATFQVLSFLYHPGQPVCKPATRIRDICATVPVVIPQQACECTIEESHGPGVTDIGGTIAGYRGPSHATVASANRFSRDAEG